MHLSLLKAKIHRATVTHSELNYEGSIAIDGLLLEATGIRKILQIELAVRPDSDQRGMTASGMIVINPPWKLEQQMNNVLPWLHSKLVPAGTGHTSVSWIVPE